MVSTILVVLATDLETALLAPGNNWRILLAFILIHQTSPFPMTSAPHFSGSQTPFCRCVQPSVQPPYRKLIKCHATPHHSSLRDQGQNPDRLSQKTNSRIIRGFKSPTRAVDTKNKNNVESKQKRTSSNERSQVPKDIPSPMVTWKN
jgi:hypothetical protein